MDKREQVNAVLARYSSDVRFTTAMVIDELNRIYGVRADDDELVTGKWLDSIFSSRKDWPNGTVDWGFNSDDPEVAVRRYSYHPDSYFALVAQKDEMDCVQIEIKSRRQFRNLCEALGVELKESE